MLDLGTVESTVGGGASIDAQLHKLSTYAWCEPATGVAMNPMNDPPVSFTNLI